jgi:hypothetical protein
MFPEIELSNGGTYAAVVTLSNRIKIYSVRPIHGRIFIIPDLGVFQLDEKYRYTFKKSEVYFFDQKSCNPLDLQAIEEIRQYLDKENLPGLTINDLQHYIPKFRVVEEGKRKLHELYNTLHKAEGIEEKELLPALMDGTLKRTADHLVALEMSKNPNLIKLDKAVFSEKTIQWLNDYYSEDVIARYNMFNRLLSERNFRLKPSLPIFGMMPQRTIGKRDIGVIVTNNRMLELDPKIKVDINEETGILEIQTEKHGIFEIQETKTRYRYGKTNIYFLAVKTAKAPKQEQEVAVSN